MFTKLCLLATQKLFSAIPQWNTTEIIKSSILWFYIIKCSILIFPSKNSEISSQISKLTKNYWNIVLKEFYILFLSCFGAYKLAWIITKYTFIHPTGNFYVSSNIINRRTLSRSRYSNRFPRFGNSPLIQDIPP